MKFLERRIIYNYAKYGDSPICIGEELDIPSQNAVTQGFGLTPDDNIGELLQLELRVLSSDECYEKFNNIPEDQQKLFNASLRTKVTGNLHEGITDQVLCTAITCDGSDLNLDNWDKCVSLIYIIKRSLDRICISDLNFYQEIYCHLFSNQKY